MASSFKCSWCNRTYKDHWDSLKCNGYCSWRCNTEIENQEKQRRAELKQRQKEGGGGCFITTATCEVLGLPDDCNELRVLRGFRDTYMAEDPGRAALVAEYYDFAPTILASLEMDPERDMILSGLFDETITPAVQAIERGDHSTALALYESMMRTLQGQRLRLR